MKLQTIIALGVAMAISIAPADARKKKTTKAKAPVAAAVKPVPADTFSYAAGLANSRQFKMILLQRDGVDSAHVATAVKAIRESATLTDAQVNEHIAYAAGLRIALASKAQGVEFLNKAATGKADTTYTNLALLNKGIADGIDGTSKISPDSAVKIVEQQMNWYRDFYKKQNADFLLKNKKLKGVKVTPSGLQYRVLTQGNGPIATDTTDVEVHYEGKLIDGTVFDSSYKRNQPATFKPKQVIKGWTEALKMMPEGSVYELYIPYDLAYGERGSQNIPPFSTLIFKVEVIKVKQPEVKKAATLTPAKPAGDADGKLIAPKKNK